MPDPIPLTRRPPHLAPPEPRPEEPRVDRRTRQLAFLRELGELNMLAARDAAHRIAEAQPDTNEAAEATLALARATRAVTQIINVENRVAAGEQARPAAPDDPRRQVLRQALHPLAAKDPNPARRRALRASLDDAIEDALLADLDDDLPLAEIAIVIAEGAGLTLDLATVSDELLGIPPRPRHEPPQPPPQPAPGP